MTTNNTTLSIASVFNKPRILYMEMMRSRTNSEIKGVLTLMRFYRQRHSDIIISTTNWVSADKIIDDFIQASIALHQATALTQVRDVAHRVRVLKKEYSEVIESVSVSIGLLYGYAD